MSELNLDRLHRVIENAADADQEGRTTALLYQMLGCAELGMLPSRAYEQWRNVKERLHIHR